jgi:FKBP-type peptidyl-prolyl cis-trans isomerase
LGAATSPFAHLSKQCENGLMLRAFDVTKFAAIIILGAFTLAGSAAAQQAPATTPSAPATQSSSTKSSATTSNGQSTTSAGATHHTPAKTAPPLVLKTDKDKQSYAVGVNVGKNLRQDSVDVDPAIVLRGLKDALAGGKTLLTDEELQAVMTQLKTQVTKAQEEKAQLAAVNNKKEGDAFLAENKTKEGVVTLPSGLQYKVLTEGTGPKPTANDSVVCNYRGTLLDGTEFDSSYKRHQPITIPVGRVIKGWTEALELMPVGSKWELYIPPDLAYGERGAGGGVIGPNSTIKFEVELLSIQPPVNPAAAKPGATAPIPATPQH